uniref:Uncharacterized protein n=1 Tax=Clytia hemisphaerica TaxID=252671 RepID=A0A7M5UN38_9CNID
MADHDYANTEVRVETTEANETTNNSVQTKDIIEGLKPYLLAMRADILKDVHELLPTSSEDSISIAAASEFSHAASSVPGASPEKENVPEGPPSEKRPRFDDDDFSDLLPKKAPPKNQDELPTLDLCQEFFNQLDKEMPDQVEYCDKVGDEIAERLVQNFTVKADNAEARKLIVARHKLPANCKEICVPKLRDSILNVKSFNEYAKRTERSYYNLQLSITQAVSCFVDTIVDTIRAEERSQVVDSRAILRNCFDGLTLLGHSSNAISNLRKKNLKPALSSQYQALCNPSRPTTQFLLGDDLNKGMQEAQESTKLSKVDKRVVIKTNSSCRSFDKHNRSSSSSSSFLERGQKPPSRHKDTKNNNSRKHKRKNN